MTTKTKQPVKVYSFSLPPDLHAQLVEAAALMDTTKSKLIADTLESAMPSLLVMAKAMAEARRGNMSPTALLAVMARSVAAPFVEHQLTIAEALEASEGAHGTRSVTGVTEAEKAPYLRNRNKSGQMAKNVQKTSKGKVSARGKAKP